jgi:AcrR family transcriptional regulator
MSSASSGFEEPRRLYQPRGTALLIIEPTGTLYKYFPDVEAILIAWHGRQTGRHLQHLAAGAANQTARTGSSKPCSTPKRSSSTNTTAPNWPRSCTRASMSPGARQQLRDFLAGLIAEGAQASRLRIDVAPSELASYCAHALAAANSLPSRSVIPDG